LAGPSQRDAGDVGGGEVLVPGQVVVDGQPDVALFGAQGHRGESGEVGGLPDHGEVDLAGAECDDFAAQS
jgi:hypothetical protein